MLFMDFSKVCEKLEGTAGRLDMIDIISKELPGLSAEELPVFVRFVMGRIFPDWSSRKLGIGPNLLYEATAAVAGIPREKVVDRINKTGDVGRAVEELLSVKSQTTFFHEDLDLVHVYNALIAIAEMEGKNSQREKLLAARRLLGNAHPLEGRYLARIMLEELRIGVGEGSVRDAIAKAFGVDASLVEHAMQALNDMGEVARLAKSGALALQDIHITLFHPVRMMLAQQGSYCRNDTGIRGDRRRVQIRRVPFPVPQERQLGPHVLPPSRGRYRCPAGRDPAAAHRYRS